MKKTNNDDGFQTVTKKSRFRPLDLPANPKKNRFGNLIDFSSNAAFSSLKGESNISKCWPKSQLKNSKFNQNSKIAVEKNPSFTTIPTTITAIDTISQNTETKQVQIEQTKVDIVQVQAKPKEVVEEIRKWLSDNQVSAYHIYKFVNLAKSFLIKWYCGKRSRVIDLGCGHGSEILKFQSTNPLFVIFVDQNREVLNNLKKHMIKLSMEKEIELSSAFICADFSKKNFLKGFLPLKLKRIRQCKFWKNRKLEPVYKKHASVDVIFSFLSLSNAAQSEDHLNSILENVADMLTGHGRFVVMVIDGEKVEKIHDSQKLFNFEFSDKLFFQTGKPYNITAPYNSKAENFFTDKDYLLYEKDLIRAAEKHKLIMAGTENLFQIHQRLKDGPNYQETLRKGYLNGFVVNSQTQNILELYKCYLFIKS